MFRRSLTTQLAVPALVVAVVGIVAIVLYAGMTARERAVDQLVQNGIDRLAEYRELRRYYTETVVAPARSAGMRVDTEHATGSDAIPLPATMIHELSERLRRHEDGFQLRLYSADPFPARRDRVLDRFGEAALARFERDPEGVFHELEEIEGRRFVRVATADRMNATACVHCHNHHPETPRTGWQLGDVRGVLVSGGAVLHHARVRSLDALGNASAWTFGQLVHDDVAPCASGTPAVSLVGTDDANDYSNSTVVTVTLSCPGGGQQDMRLACDGVIDGESLEELAG